MSERTPCRQPDPLWTSPCVYRTKGCEDFHPETGICSQHGCWPGEMYEDHPHDGGVGELELRQYDPPVIIRLAMCYRCWNDLFNFCGFGPLDDRFKWLNEPTR